MPDKPPSPSLKGFAKADEWGDGDRVKWLEVEPGKEITKTIHLEQAVIGRLEPGDYSVNVVYTNLMGKDCFKGHISGPTIQITLQEK